MQTSPTYATPGGVDPSELDRHIAEMYHDVPNPIRGGGIHVAHAARGRVSPNHKDRGGLKMSTVTDTVRHGMDTEKLTIRVAAKTSLPAERVLDAGRNFSERRADVWSNVKVKHLEVHERGKTFADVTEGTWVVGLF